MFFDPTSKNSGICEVFSNRAAENTGIYDGFSSFEDSRQTSTKDKNTVKTSVSGLRKIRKLVQKRVQNHKKTLPGHPTSASRKKHVANPKNESKKLKNPRFFHFFLARFGGRSNEQVYSVLFFTVFCEGERHDLSKTGRFFQKMPPPPGKPEP